MVELVRGCNISLKFSADDGTEYKVIPSDQFK